jgi:4-hydroxymandelate oxidase
MTPVDFHAWVGEHQMLSRLHQIASRRHLLQFLAASPVLAHAAIPAFAQGTTSRSADPLTWAPRELNKLIENPGQALDVFDFEPVMKENVPPVHFGYMATGVDDEVTLHANREAFQRFQLRPRRLIDVSRIDMRTDILGTTYDSPIVISPTSSNKAFHPEGELAVAKAARAGNHLQMLSTVATTSIEDAIAARGAPVPALPDAEVGGRRSPGQTRGTRWQPGDRGHPLCAGEAKLGDAVPAAAYGRPSM